MVGRLAPVSEEPLVEEGSDNQAKRKATRLRELILQKLPQLFQKKQGDRDLRLLVSVLGCPLSPIDVQPPARRPLLPAEVSSTAQYIVQQFRATTLRAEQGREQCSVYASGKVKMATMADDRRRAGSGAHYEGRFVLWQMSPSMWLAELFIAGSNLAAGSNGKIAWRRTPWLRTHAAPGSARPLRRFLQGLDPALVAGLFSAGEYAGEERIEEEDCFVLKLSADERALSQRSNASTEIVKHQMKGYFSQKSGLLVYMEDSQLSRIEQPGLQPAFWETVMRSYLNDYRLVDGVLVAHGGRTAVSMSRVAGAARITVTEMEETWVIDDVAFDVRGLSAESFILPEEIRCS
ncbi:uncharacterized protein LOC144706989 [Wolffia australiana]